MRHGEWLERKQDAFSEPSSEISPYFRCCHFLAPGREVGKSRGGEPLAHLPATRKTGRGSFGSAEIWERRSLPIIKQEKWVLKRKEKAFTLDEFSLNLLSYNWNWVFGVLFPST